MKDRLSSAQRILDVQMKLRRIGELKVAELQREEQALGTEEMELIEFLAGESPFAGVLSPNIVRRLRRNSQKQRETRIAKESEKATVLERAARVKAVERIIGELHREIKQHEQKRELNEVIEQFLTRLDASFPKG